MDKMKTYSKFKQIKTAKKIKKSTQVSKKGLSIRDDLL